jgi:hypothetical protein
LELLAEIADHAGDEVEGDDHEHDDEESDGHTGMVASASPMEEDEWPTACVPRGWVISC